MQQTNRAQTVFRRRIPAVAPTRNDGPRARRFAKRVNVRFDRHQARAGLRGIRQ